MKPRMNAPGSNRSSMAGGFLLAVGILVGTVGGGLLGQPSIGFLAGTAIGIALVAFVWAFDRRRS
jgi:hypothetical protein